MPSAKISFASFTFDTEERLLFRDGRRVHLRPQAVRALDCLIRRRGHIVSRRDLAQFVWNGSTPNEDQALNVLIRSVRSALDDDPMNPAFIETIPTRGYRFMANVRSDTEPNTRDGRKRWLIGIPVVALLVFFAMAINSVDRQPPAVAPLTIADVPVAARLSFMQGLDLFNEGRTAESRQHFENVVALAPEFAEGHLWLGKSYVAVWGAGIAEADIAKPHILEAAKLNPGLPDTYVELGSIEMIANLDAQGAVKWANRALAIDPRHLNALILLIDTRLAVGDPAGAVTYMEQIDAIDPLRLASMGSQGWIYYMAGNYEAAANHCRIAVGIGVGVASARNCLYEAYLSIGQLEMALREARTLMLSEGATDAEIAVIIDDVTPAANKKYLEWRLQKTEERFAAGADPYAMAVTNLRLGYVDKAASHLQQVIDERRYPSIAFIASDPRLDALTRDAAYRPSFDVFREGPGRH